MKLYMAPLQSYTTAFYRCAHAITYGYMDKYFTPFFEDTNKEVKELMLQPELSAEFNKGLYCIPQVATNNGLFVTRFARQIQELGFKEMNINMGCPFPMLTKRERGGGILKHPDSIKAMLDDFFKEDLSIKLSVKMRIGFDSPSEGENVIQLLDKYPIKEVIIHPRLVTQKYDGEPDWHVFEQLSKQSQHSIIANGDINTTEDAKQITRLYPFVNGLMLGRGLLSNPSLPNQIQSRTAKPQSIFDLHDNYFSLVTNYFNDWNRSFNHLVIFWHYPLQHEQQLKRHFRKLKKHNKPDTYHNWLTALKENMLP